jgi:adenylate cyclase
LWYFVLLVSHAARFGFIGSIISPIIFSIIYIGGLYIRGLEFPPHTLAIRCTFFIITGSISGYLAREEHKRFINILSQQKQIFIAHQKRKELRELLERYVSYNVVEELMRHPEELKMGGSKKKVSVLFSDIQGFTGLLSGKNPESMVSQLNEYLTEMSNIIFEYNGMVDKFVGDAVIGIFGAISESLEDSKSAVRCALAMQKKMLELQERWKRDAAPVFYSRIAVNTGYVIMGNIGSAKRMDFTAIGDTVNMASRLQAVAQAGSVVISSETCNEVKDIFRLKSLGEMQIKGKAELIEAFEVIGERQR